MRAIRWLSCWALLACAPPAAPPSIAPEATPVQGTAAASAAAGSTSLAGAGGASAVVPSTPLPRAAARPPLAKVVPRATVRPVDDTYDDRANEGWPEITYQGFPAVSLDGTRVALVEERDGWGHVPKFGVRVVEVGSGKSLEWFELAPANTPPKTRAALVSSVATIAKRITPLNEMLAKTEWLALDGRDVTPDGDWTWRLRGLVVAATWSEEEVPQPKRLVVREEANQALVVDRDLAAWSRKGVRCAMNDLVLVGASEGLLVFRQGVGPTLHDCDGVVVPIAYRMVPLARQ